MYHEPLQSAIVSPLIHNLYLVISSANAGLTIDVNTMKSNLLTVIARFCDRTFYNQVPKYFSTKNFNYNKIINLVREILQFFNICQGNPFTIKRNFGVRAAGVKG